VSKSKLLLIFSILAGICLVLLPACSNVRIIGEWKGENFQNPIEFKTLAYGNINGRDYIFGSVTSLIDTKESNIQSAQSTLIILDINKPEKPIQSGLLKAPEKNSIETIGITDTTLYAAGTRCLWIVNVSNPSAPKEITRNYNIQATDMVISEQTALIFELHEIEDGKYINLVDRVDISQPYYPQLIEKLPIPIMSTKALAVKSRLFWQGADGIHISDIAFPDKEIGLIPDVNYKPSQPGVTPTVTFNTLSKEEAEAYDPALDLNDFAVQDDKLFAASGSDGLVIFDISNPANPKQLSSYKVSEKPNSSRILVDGKLAYLFEGSKHKYINKLYILNISDLYNPQILETIEVSSDSARSNFERFIESRGYLYGCGSNEFPTVQIIDVKNLRK
jgi:hypothetical protein